MSVTFIQQPDLYTSGFDPTIFLASSNQTTQTNFRYRIRILNSIGQTVSEFRQPAYYEDGTCLFDAHRTVENYLSYDISKLIVPTYGWQTGINTLVEFSVNIAEEYGTVIAAYASATSSVIKSINSAQTYLKRINNPIINRLIDVSDTGNWLTNQPTIDIRMGDSYQLSLIETGGVILKLTIKTYDAANTLLKTGTLNGVAAVKARSILVGPDDINNTTLTTGTQPLIQDNTAYYEVYAESVSTIVTNILRFNIDRSCLRDSYNRIFWLNPLGGIDGFNFTQMPDDSISVEASTYNKLQGVRTSASFTYKTYGQERSNFFNKSKQTYKLRSGYINTEVSTWLKELIQSPIAWMVIDGQFVGINITTTSYQAKTTLQEKLFNIELEVELSVDTQRQRL